MKNFLCFTIAALLVSCSQGVGPQEKAVNDGGTDSKVIRPIREQFREVFCQKAFSCYDFFMMTWGKTFPKLFTETFGDSKAACYGHNRAFDCQVEAEGKRYSWSVSDTESSMKRCLPELEATESCTAFADKIFSAECLCLACKDTYPPNIPQVPYSCP